MTSALIAFAVLALIAVVAGEVAELPFARRKAAAGRSRLPASPERGGHLRSPNYGFWRTP